MYIRLIKACLSVCFVFFTVNLIQGQNADLLADWDVSVGNWGEAPNFIVTSNPLPNDTNRSKKCGKYVTTRDQYDKVYYDFSTPVNFYDHPKVGLKVFLPSESGSGTVTLRFQDKKNKNGVSRYLTCTPGVWNDLIADFTGEGKGNFDRLVIFFDFSETTPGKEYFIDDVLRFKGNSNEIIEINPSDMELPNGSGLRTFDDFSRGALRIKPDWQLDDQQLEINYKKGVYQVILDNPTSEDIWKSVHFKNKRFDDLSGKVYSVNLTLEEDIYEYESDLLGDNSGVMLEVPAESRVVARLYEVKDCAGVRGGSAVMDSCGACAGGLTGIDPIWKESQCKAFFEDLEDDSDTLISLRMNASHHFSLSLPGSLSGLGYILEDAHGETIQEGQLGAEQPLKYELLEVHEGIYFLKVNTSGLGWLGEIRIRN